MKERINKLELESANEGFWDNKNSAYKILQEIKISNDKLKFIQNINDNFELLNFHIEISNTENVVSSESINHLKLFEIQIEKLEINSILNNKDDHRNAILNIHPGAGGKESEDWAFMLFRMYKRWVDNNNFNMKILNYQDGDENG